MSDYKDGVRVWGGLRSLGYLPASSIINITLSPVKDRLRAK